MVENKFHLFLNKETVQEGEKGNKPTYLAQLFSGAKWFPRLQNIPLAIQKSTLKPSKAVEQAPLPDTIEVKTQPPVIPVAPVKELKRIKIEDPRAVKTVRESEFLLNSDFTSLLQTFNPDWDESQIAGIDDFSQNVQVLFLGLNEFKQSELPEITPVSLIESEQDLLGKMIKAMNLKQGQFVRYPLIKGDLAMEFFLAGILKFKPRIVVSLGATATNLILEKNSKLSSVHGTLVKKAFKINNEMVSVNISPLFHPQLLEINQSMKRTTWLDMKKVMEFLES